MRLNPVDRSPNSESQYSPIPDPWEEESLSSGDLPWHFQPEAHPLIGPAVSSGPPLASLENPTIRRLAAPIATSIQTLLEDGIKVNAYRAGHLKTRLEQALALLAWLNTQQHAAIA